MDILLFFAVAAICAILGDLYLCWQVKQYDAITPEEPGSEELTTGPEAEKEPLPSKEEAAPDATPSASKENGPPEENPPSAKKGQPMMKAIGSGWSLKTMRIIAAVLAFPVAALVTLYSYRVAHGSDSGELEYVLKLLCILELLIPIGLIDAKYMKIPNKVLLCGLGFFAAFFLVELFVLKQGLLPLLKETAYGLLLGGGVFLVTGLISRTGMGGGDIKLFALLGMMMMWRGVFNVIFFSVLFIVVYSLFLLATKKAKKDTRIPMGPFATLAMLVVILLGI